MITSKKLILIVMILPIMLVACGGTQATPQAPSEATTAVVTEAPATEAPPQELTKVRLQLQWVTQAQFAGYYVADALGYYKDEGIEVEIKPGGPDIIPVQVVSAGEADFGAVIFNSVLQAREAGADLVSLATIIQRTPQTLVSLKETGVNGPADIKGKIMGSWLGGNEAEQFALMRKYGIDPDTEVTIVRQGFDMSQLLNGDIDVAMAQVYNEYAQLFEVKNPETGELYKPEDFNVIFMQDEGLTQIQDNIFTREAFLSQPGNEDLAKRFLKASLKGWIYCRDHQNECVDIVLNSGSALGESHQQWMMNEVNALIWPAPNGIGIPNDDQAIANTLDIALTYNLLSEPPDEGSWRFDLTQQALDELNAEGLDIYGLDFTKETVVLKEGGQ